MSRYLITQTLISAWSYCHTCYEACAEDAYADFVSVLRREPRTPNEDMQNGIDFENEVYRIVRGEALTSTHPKWKKGIEAVATILNGAQTQVKAYRDLNCNGLNLLVYGKLDALKAGIIQDVKFSNKGFSSADLQGKYLDSPQHSCYLYLVPEARQFDYVVSDGEDVYVETYTRKMARPFSEVAAEFIDGITAMNLLDEYKKHWQAA